MKIKTIEMPLEDVLSLPKREHKKPKKPTVFFRTLMRILSKADLNDVSFTYESNLGEAENSPCLILMNHSSFIDLEIASEIFKKKPYCIVTTSDGFVGKEWLMRSLGCIPTNKFVSDLSLIRDMKYCINNLGTSVLMYPEASYSFDGRATPLPRGLSRLLRILDCPVVMVKTEGAFTRDPLYNCLIKRKVKVSAKAECLITRDMIKNLPEKELEEILDKAFTFDNFAWQEENDIRIDESERAKGLERIIYRCPHCHNEGTTKGEGTRFSCSACNNTWDFDTLSRLVSPSGEILRIPELYDAQREAVRKEIEDGSFKIETPVKIGVMVDYKAIYMVGNGQLRHDENGFTLEGCDGKLNYKQSPLFSYSLYSDYFWYELGDIICIGNNDILYYCFPEREGVVSKARIAAEELYKIHKQSKTENR